MESCIRSRQRQWALFDLAADPGEQVNLAEDERERVKEMADAWKVWSTRVGVQNLDRATLFRLFAPPGTVMPKGGI